MPRLFIAIPVPESVGASWLGRMRELPRAIRRVPPAQLHLTLHFLGEVALEPARAALAGLVTPPIRLRPTAPGVFGRHGGKAVLWMGIEPVPALMALQASVGERLRANGIATERREFRPHVTLARGRVRRGDPAVEAWLSAGANGAGEGFEAGRVVLYSSVLGAGGASYRVEDEFQV